jgi:hypothetical protein
MVAFFASPSLKYQHATDKRRGFREISIIVKTEQERRLLITMFGGTARARQ